MDRTLFEFRLYHPKPRNAAQAFAQEYSKVQYRDVLLEDMGILEQVQIGLSSGAKSHFNLQDSEICVRHAYRAINEFVSSQ